MTAAGTCPAPLSVPLPTVPGVRPARREDAAELAALSGPFARSGALRERPVSLYAAHADEFLVMRAAGGPVEGAVGLRVHPGGVGPVGVVYNFCVAGHRQGCGVGAGLLRAVLDRARDRSLGALFTATTGSGRLFLRHGFAPTAAHLAPPAWARSLDPRRGARILARPL
ncbi:GNAT family N-acetyltransferase [Streptomyces sp. NPDC057499]|uniref:GNAT family N-acetyltransferase n=1 Tax=Streptomyces sp. NPDC057499 TaxID=3346150 RepID=UPI0036C83577